MNNLIVVLSGPSGAGKDSIYNEIKRRREDIYKCVSVTTRARRENEVEGINYTFSTVEKFKKLEREGYFLETNFYNGSYYGTPKPLIEDGKDRDMFFILNAEGGMKVKKEYPEAILIYILPRNVEQLKEQRGDRGDERHQLGISEIPIAMKFDWLIINETIEKSASQIEEILEMIRRFRMANENNQQFLKDYY